MINKSKADAKAQTKRTEEFATVSVIEAQSNLQATKARCHALAEEGRSELKNLDGFDAQRHHEFELKKAEVYEELARNNRNLVVSGDSGESIINSLFELDEKKK